MRTWCAWVAVLAAGCAGPSDGAPCAPDEEGGGCLASVRLTYLNVPYDLSQPVYVNNRVPIELGITSTSVDPGVPATRNVAVGISFVEAEPVDPSAPIECGSSALDLTLVGDGTEQIFRGFVWPTTLCEALVGRPVALRVDFDGGEELESDLDAPSIVLSEARRNDALNRGCRSVADRAAPELGLGCAYSFDLRSTPTDAVGNPVIDVRYATLEAASSVAVLPRADEEREAAPSLVVQSTLVVNGRDPYVSGVAPEAVPPELEAMEPGITEDLQFGLDPAELGRLTAMPGCATLRYELAPAGDETGWLPLAIEVGEEHVAEALVESLLPGTSNTFVHELFAEGETRAALEPGGAWADVSDFSVRGCFDAVFAQEGNAGEGDTSDCRVIAVVMVRERPSASSAASIAFDGEMTRELGNSRIGIAARLVTQNRLDRDGASSRVEGSVELRGNLGRSFSVTVARAMGQGNVSVASGEAGYELAIDAFGQRVISVSESGTEVSHEEELSTAKSFSFPGLGFGFGPVRVGFRFSLGGEVGLATDDGLSVSRDDAECASLLGTSGGIGVCGSISRTITPSFNFTASIEGGVDLRLVRAGVVADLDLVVTEFPLDASLAWGLGQDGRLMVLGRAHWDLQMRLIRGQVAIVGRVGIRRFSRTLRVNVFSFSSDRVTRTLLDRSMDVLEVLD